MKPLWIICIVVSALVAACAPDNSPDCTEMSRWVRLSGTITAPAGMNGPVTLRVSEADSTRCGGMAQTPGMGLGDFSLDEPGDFSVRVHVKWAPEGYPPDIYLEAFLDMNGSGECDLTKAGGAGSSLPKDTAGIEINMENNSCPDPF